MSASNLSTVKSNITSVNTPDQIDSWSELQGIVSLVRVNDYAVNSSNSTPTLTDYQAFFTYGQSGKSDMALNSVTLNALNSAVNAKPSNAFTAAELKSLVEGYVAILAEANGNSVGDQQTYNPSASDYLAVGVGTGTSYDQEIKNMLGDAALVNLLTDTVANKNTTDVDTVGELNSLALIITKIGKLVSAAPTSGGSTGIFADAYTAGISGGALQVSELSSLGLDTSNLTNNNYSTNVLSKRLYSVYDQITALDATNVQNIDSLQELQQLINNTSVI